MSWTRVSAVLPAVLAACARVSVEGAPDAGPLGPAVAAIDPQPGAVAAGSTFTVQFDEALDEGDLIAPSGRSETVVLASDADAERAAAAIAHAQVSAEERKLFMLAQPEIAGDLRSIALTPDQPLPAGKYVLLVSPRLRDDAGRRLGGNGARYSYQVAAAPPRPVLVSPLAGAMVPMNLAEVHAFAETGALTLVDAGGTVVAGPLAAKGDAVLLLPQLDALATYRLALDGVPDDSQSFTVAACVRKTPPSLQDGAAAVVARDVSVTASVVLDWPAAVELQVAPPLDAGADLCDQGCLSVSSFVTCSPPACGGQAFVCRGTLELQGLSPATDYDLRVVAYDDLGYKLQSAPQRFSTLAPLPHLIVSEVLADAPATGEYLELWNQGPGAADLSGLALVEADGTAHPVLGSAPPLPLQLKPGGRALAVGAGYVVPASLPPATPILRAGTQRLLGRGLSDQAPPALTLSLGGLALSQFPGGAHTCPAGASLQRDEAVAADAPAQWSCGPVGGTPGAPP